MPGWPRWQYDDSPLTAAVRPPPTVSNQSDSSQQQPPRVETGLLTLDKAAHSQQCSLFRVLPRR